MNLWLSLHEAFRWVALSGGMSLFLTKLTYNIGLKLIVTATIIVEPPSLVIPVIEEPLPIVVLCIAISSLMVGKTHASIIYGDI